MKLVCRRSLLAKVIILRNKPSMSSEKRQEDVTTMTTSTTAEGGEKRPPVTLLNDSINSQEGSCASDLDLSHVPLKQPCLGSSAFSLEGSISSGPRLTLNSSSTLQVPNLKTSVCVKEPYSFEEEVDVIRKCKALSIAALGHMKSFSTSDITDVDTDGRKATLSHLRLSTSEIVLSCESALLSHLESQTSRRLEAVSRSCSTWVAVGEPLGSQLHSPQTHSAFSGAESTVGSTFGPSLTPMALVQSVNKKVRDTYIRKRIVSTYKALERLTRSQVDIKDIPGMERLATSPSTLSITTFARKIVASSPPASPREEVRFLLPGRSVTNTKLSVSSSYGQSGAKPKRPLDWERLHEDLSALTVRDIEVRKGKPLSKYERNMMIFNWLAELEDRVLDLEDLPLPEQMTSTS